MATIIRPTVGRVVLFWPDGAQPTDQPRAAIVAAVWSDRCVNLMVIEPNGVPQSHPATSVQLVQEGDELPKRADGTLRRHCRWMAFQLGQAAKAEAAEKAAAAK